MLGVRRLFQATLVAALIGTGGFVSVSAAPAEAQAGGMSGAELTTLFNEYGNTSGRWAGGDSTASVALPDGRTAWLFSDTFVGQVNADHSLPNSVAFVNNTAVLQDGRQLVETRTGGTAASPGPLVPTGTANEWYWVANGVTEGSQLRVLYNRYRRAGSGPLDFTLLGTALATFSLPALTLTNVVELPVGDEIAWGSAITSSAGYTYIYGTESHDELKFAHVARVPTNGLSGSWTFWTGSGWSSDGGMSARLLSGVNVSFGVQQVGGQYVLVTMDSNLVFNSAVVAYTSPSPTGPFTGPIYLFDAPEPAAGSDAGKPVIVYDARLHPNLATSGKLLVSYNVNSLEIADVRADIRNYRPRFVDVDWPRPVPDPDAVPRAPSSVTATPGDEGDVLVSWQQPVGTNLRYWVYRRDVTAGQTHFVREKASTTQTSVRVGRVKDGRSYEFKVTAENAAGEGPSSAPVTATVRVSPPPAPTGVVASAAATGQLTVSWAAVPNAWGYQIWLRDLTEGDETFLPVTAVGQATTATIDWIDDGHEYELYVTARHGGGDSPPSMKIRVTADHSPPGAPTGLVSTTNADGTIGLSWTAPGPDLWYWVYQRDVTAQETEFTQLSLPISTGTSMTAGYLAHEHEYEFRVTAISRIGEGPPSASVRAIARYPKPGAPTGLVASATDGEVRLTWSASPTAGAWYWVYQRNVTDGETEFTQLPLPVSACCTMTAGYLTNGDVYEFALTAISAGGESERSNLVRATPQVPLPGPVTGLTAAANSDGTIGLTWTEPGPDLWYWVYQRDVTAGETNFTKLALPVTSCCTFKAGLLQHNHVYQFRVAAISSAGDGPQSATAQATARFAAPGAPANLRGVSAGDGTIDLAWDAPAAGDFYYWMYYRDVTAGHSGFTKGAFPTTSLSASLGVLVHGHTYEFKVTAENQGGEGQASTPVRVIARGGLPLPPTGLVATAGDGEVSLRWTASPTSGVFYNVYTRDATSNGSWQKLQLPATGTSMTAEYLANGRVYEFKVTASNAAGDSAASNVASARPLPPLPRAPTGLTASAGDGRVTLRWTASTTPNVGYWIELRSRGGSWQRLQYPVPSCCTNDVSLLTNGTTYEFRVVASNLAGNSPASNVASARPLPPFPQAPTNLSATASGNGNVTLRWTASSTPRVWYWIELRSKGGSWRRLEYPHTSCCTSDVSYLVNGVTYDFRLRATNAAGDSSPSNVTSARPTVPMSGRPVIGGASSGQNGSSLWWTAVPNATAYWVEVMDLSARASSWSRLTYPVTGTSFKPGLLMTGNWYRWRVIPVNGAQEGTPSTPVEIRTRGKVFYSVRNIIGDSYSSGTGAGSESGSCVRSPYAWPLRINAWSTSNYHLACHGAEVPDVRSTQLPSLRLPADLTLITLTIGGNDVGFGGELENCIKSDCIGQRDAIAGKIDRMKSTLTSFYRELRTRAPGADIVVAGYPLLIVAPGGGWCGPIAGYGLSDEEQRMIRTLGNRLNSVIAQAAVDAGVTAATHEVVAAFAGHEACADDEYIHQVIVGQRDYSFHPNGTGHGAYGFAVSDRMRVVERYGQVRF